MNPPEMQTRKPFRFNRVESHILYPVESKEISESCSRRPLDVSKSFEGIVSQNLRVTKQDIAESLRSFSFRDCRNCTVSIEVPCASVFLHGMDSCRVTVSAALGSIQISDCVSTDIQGFCGQLRITDSRHILVEVQTTSSTAIVNSKGIKVSRPPTIDSGSHFAQSILRLGWDLNTMVSSRNWRDIRDFNCLSENSTNWSFFAIE